MKKLTTFPSATVLGQKYLWISFVMKLIQIGLLKVLDDEVSKFRKELVNKFQRENK